MTFNRTLIAALLGVSLTVGSIAPAEARPRGWNNGGWGGGWHDNGRRRHRGDGFGLGDAIGVAAIIGAVAVVANSVSKDRAATRATGPDYRPQPEYDARDYDRGDDAPLAGEDSAVDSCAVAAREEATVSGGYAEIRNIGSPQPIEGGYNIDGEVERRGSYRDAAGETRRFTCTVHGNKVTDVYLSRDLVSN
ncbi:MAG: hypothetical protein ACSLE1_01285 [Sphingobium sp.]